MTDPSKLAPKILSRVYHRKPDPMTGNPTVTVTFDGPSLIAFFWEMDSLLEGSNVTPEDVKLAHDTLKIIQENLDLGYTNNPHKGLA